MPNTLPNISLGCAVYGTNEDYQIFSSFACGFFFFETQPFVVVPKRFYETVGVALFGAPDMLEASRLNDPKEADQQRLIDLCFENTEFAAVPLARTVLIDEEQDHTSGAAVAEIGARVKIEGADEGEFYVCALQTRYKDTRGGVIDCPAMLSCYGNGDSGIEAGLLGRQILCEGKILGVITAINAARRLVFLSSLEVALIRVYELCGIQGGEYPRKIYEWNSAVRLNGAKLKDEKGRVSVDKILKITNELLLVIKSFDKPTAKSLKELRAGYRAAHAEELQEQVASNG